MANAKTKSNRISGKIIGTISLAALASVFGVPKTSLAQLAAPPARVISEPFPTSRTQLFVIETPKGEKVAVAWGAMQFKVGGKNVNITPLIRKPEGQKLGEGITVMAEHPFGTAGVDATKSPGKDVVFTGAGLIRLPLGFDLRAVTPIGENWKNTTAAVSFFRKIGDKGSFLTWIETATKNPRKSGYWVAGQGSGKGMTMQIAYQTETGQLRVGTVLEASGKPVSAFMQVQGSKRGFTKPEFRAGFRVWKPAKPAASAPKPKAASRTPKRPVMPRRR
ncbi:MAG: hypothetical protein Q7S21_02580 [archaeon]|nr:hypothetical protein [archaeon]